MSPIAWLCFVSLLIAICSFLPAASPLKFGGPSISRVSDFSPARHTLVKLDGHKRVKNRVSEENKLDEESSEDEPEKPAPDIVRKGASHKIAKGCKKAFLARGGLTMTLFFLVFPAFITKLLQAAIEKELGLKNLLRTTGHRSNRQLADDLDGLFREINERYERGTVGVLEQEFPADTFYAIVACIIVMGLTFCFLFLMQYHRQLAKRRRRLEERKQADLLLKLAEIRDEKLELIQKGPKKWRDLYYKNINYKP